MLGKSEDWKQEKTLECRTGRTFQIRLWEDRTRGEIYVPQYDPHVFSLVNDDYERAVGENWIIVDSGKRVFEFKADKPGTHRIVFEKRMGWRFTAEDRRVYVIAVDGEAKTKSSENA